MKAIISERAMTSLLVETYEKRDTETGGLFLGRYVDGIIYVVESIDPGPNSVFEFAYFEYDVDYVNHLINKISRLYAPQLDLVGLWHRHPGSFDSFSGVDDGTNKKYAALNDFGAISGLVNIDPDFRLTLYSVELPLNYEKIKYEVGEIPASICELKNKTTLIKQLSNNTISITTKQNKSLIRTLSDSSAKVKIIKKIRRFFKENGIKKKQNIEKEELLLDELLDVLDLDLKFFGNNKIDLNMKMNDSKTLNLHTDNYDFELNFCKYDDEYYVWLGNKIYRYKKGLFRRIEKFYE